MPGRAWILQTASQHRLRLFDCPCSRVQNASSGSKGGSLSAHITICMHLQVSKLVAAVAEQLLATPALSLWALFAAMHLPDPQGTSSTDTGGTGTRGALVTQLLTRLAPLLRRSQEARGFVTDRLGIDGRLVAGVLAEWAACSFDSQGQ